METEREEIEESGSAAEPAAPVATAEEPAAAPAEGEAAAPRADADDRRPRGRGGRRRRVCIMCADKMKTVDYKNVSFLRRFISDRGRIDTRRKTSACAKHQRAIASAIKRARHLALLPYTPEHIRNSGIARR
jgi:small subunit ribosomal protein S18